MSKKIIWITFAVVVVLLVGILIFSQTSYAQNSGLSGKLGGFVEKTDLTAGLFGSLFVNCGTGIVGCEEKESICAHKQEEKRANTRSKAREREITDLQRCESKKASSLSKAYEYRTRCAGDAACFAKADQKQNVANEKYTVCVQKANSKKEATLEKARIQYDRGINKCESRSESCRSKVISRCVEKSFKD